MRLDAVVELVSALDPATFRDLAMLALRARGIVPVLTDGPYDGGRDLALYEVTGQPIRTWVQLSVEKKWQRKLAEAVAATRASEHRLLLFVSACRVPERTFQALKDEHLRTAGVVVDRLDAQGIGSLAVDPDRGFVPELLRLLAIPVDPAPPQPYRKDDLRQRVAYACALFHDDAEDLRRSVLERAVCSAIAADAAVDRDEVVRRVALALGLAEPRHALIRGAVDRLRQRGVILGTNGAVVLSEVARAEGQLERGLREEQWRRFDAELGALLASELVPAAVADAKEAVIGDLGPLVLAAAASTVGEVVSETRTERVVELRARVRRLRQTLTALGVRDVDRLLDRIGALTEASGLGRHLLAGELFLQLVSVERSHLVAALGAGRDLEVVLDASVAIPLLCARSHGPARHRSFMAAEHLAVQLEVHRIRATVPRPHLEEAASHLWQAWSEYGDVVELDPDLRASENAFVAHYAGLRAAGAEVDFETYLADHGLGPALRRAAFPVAREALMTWLQRRFGEYGVEVVDVAAPAAHRRRAEEAVSFALRERGHERPAVLVDHDVAVVAWLFGAEGDASVARVLTTWDGALAYLHDRDQPSWEVLDPVALGDLLALLRPDGEGALRCVSAAVLAVTDQDAERGARIWDLLVSIDRSGLRDAELRRQALAFKRAFVERTAGDPRRIEVQRAWEAWKAGLASA